MARSLRIEYDGAWDQVINRGASRGEVCMTDEQRRYFLTLVGGVKIREIAQRFGMKPYASVPSGIRQFETR